MLVLNATQTSASISMADLIDSLQNAFGGGIQTTPRRIERLPGGKGDRLFLSMRAFDETGRTIVKLVTYFPDNIDRDLPIIQALVTVFSQNGQPIAQLDGTTITKLRTGAASALASKYLSRRDSSHLVLIGAGAQAPAMALAHCTVRSIRKITVCGRNPERIVSCLAGIRSVVHESVQIVSLPLSKAVIQSADIISCATTSADPVLLGRWLRPGTFIDLVGSFLPDKREADNDVISRSRIFVDTFGGALSEAGDIIIPMNAGILSRADIEGEISDLVSGRAVGRRSNDEITLFKSVGTAVEDFAAATLIVEKLGLAV